MVRSIARSGVSPPGARVPAATITTGAKPHGQQQLARDLEVERAVVGYAASGKVGLVSVHLSRIQRLLQAVMNLSQLAE